MRKNRRSLQNIAGLIIITISCYLGCSGSQEITGSPGNLKPIKLLKPQTDSGMPLMKALKNRKTIRSLSPKKIPDQVLSNLLWAAFGVNRPESGDRTAPSAMNWQVIDIYVALEQGVYIYNAEKHVLLPVLDRDAREDTLHLAQPLKWELNDAPLHLVYVADSKKRGFMDLGMSQQKGDMYSTADTGHISQNVYLFCASEGLGTVTRGLFPEEKLRKILRLRPEQKIILAQTVGYPD